jgi:tyrosine-protein kinase Tec
VEPPHEDFDVVALYDYAPSDTADLPLTKGQLVRIINSTRPHWWKARNSRNQEGYVPSNYVKKIGMETEDWFFPELTRTRAEQILKEEGKEGGFVIRPSGKLNSNYKYALSICHENQVRHYHIKQDDGDKYYISDKHRFISVVELVTYHKSNGGGLVTRLRRPPAQLVPNQPTLSSMFDDKWEIDKRDLHLGKELGSGQFGRVVKGVWKGTVEVAIKMMKERSMNEEDFAEEAQVMIRFQHPNLVQFYGICTRQGPIYIVTELMVNGCLLTYIRQRKDLTTKPDLLLDMSIQVCSAMKYLESSKFIHRDLAARNCLVGKRNVVKVGDFGLARHVADDEYTASEGTKFPIKWAAPEVISHARFSSKSDVWSYGILMWELFSGGKTPYPSFTNPQVFEEVLKGYRLPQPAHCPGPVYGVMKEIWQQTPDDRPTFNSLLMKLTQVGDHDYFEADIL